MISRNYLINALEIKYEGFSQKMKNNEKIDFEREDIDYLYWLSGSIAGSIQASQGDPQYLIDLPKIKKFRFKFLIKSILVFGFNETPTFLFNSLILSTI